MAPSSILPVGAAGHSGEHLTHRVDVVGERHLVRWELVKPGDNVVSTFKVVTYDCETLSISNKCHHADCCILLLFN